MHLAPSLAPTANAKHHRLFWLFHAEPPRAAYQKRGFLRGEPIVLVEGADLGLNAKVGAVRSECRAVGR